MLRCHWVRLIRQVLADIGRPLDTLKKAANSTTRSRKPRVAGRTSLRVKVRAHEASSSRRCAIRMKRQVSSSAANKTSPGPFCYQIFATSKCSQYSQWRLSEIHKNHKEGEDKKPKKDTEKKEQKRKDVKHDKTNKSKDVHSRRDF